MTAGTKAAPGPWFALENGGDDPDTTRRIICAKRSWDGELAMIAEVDRDLSDFGGEVEATARLIAAAPDMLAALKAIKDDAEEMIADIAADIQEGAQLPSEELNKWTRVIAAIAKAEAAQ